MKTKLEEIIIKAIIAVVWAYLSFPILDKVAEDTIVPANSQPFGVTSSMAFVIFWACAILWLVVGAVIVKNTSKLFEDKES